MQTPEGVPETPVAFETPPLPSKLVLEEETLEHAITATSSIFSMNSLEEASPRSSAQSSENSSVVSASGKQRLSLAQQNAFADAEAMKEAVRANLQTHVYNVHDYYKTEGIWQKIAKNHIFENFTLGVISFNACWMFVDTDYNHEDALVNAHPVFQVVENFFCFFFTFEWLVRYMAFAKISSGLKDPWFVFDSCLVALMVGETWVMSIVLIVQGGGNGLGGQASLLRLLRLLRLSRLARMLRALPELLIMIKGIGAAMRSVMLVLILLMIDMYIFAIILRQVTEGSPSGEMYFSSIQHAMYTLLVHGTFLDNLTVVATDIGRDSLINGSIFFLFIVGGSLCVMNMLIGILCEVVMAVSTVENEELVLSFVRDKVTDIMVQMGGQEEDGQFSISQAEFLNLLGNKECVIALYDVGVDPEGLIDFADFIFQDTAGDAARASVVHSLTLPDFLEIILQLRGSNTATVKDVVDLRAFVTKEITKHLRKFKSLSGKLQKANSILGRERSCGDSSSRRVQDKLKEMISELQKLSKFDAGQPVSNGTVKETAKHLSCLGDALLEALQELRPPEGMSTRADVELRVWRSRLEQLLLGPWMDAMQAFSSSLSAFKKGNGLLQLPPEELVQEFSTCLNLVRIQQSK